MNFADIINQEQKKLEESQGGGEKVEYPQTKHKRLFFTKDQKDLLIQVLPCAAIIGAFAEPARKIFLSAKSSQGKDVNSNFTLDAEPNPGSLLENKIAEWSDKGWIPNGFGGQTAPRRVYLVNVVSVINHNGQWVQERDQEGNLVVRVFEMPQSGYQNLLRKLGDPLYNVSGTDLSFMDPNRPSPIKISKPAKGQMEYPVEVYSTITLPPLGQGWENQLENLKEHATPTERLVNGDKWVQAFVDMKEGRKPNQGQQQQDANQAPPQQNPYAQAQHQMPPSTQQYPNTNPTYGQQTNTNTYGQPQQPPQTQQMPENTYNPQGAQMGQQPQSIDQQMPTGMGMGQGQQQQPQYQPPVQENPQDIINSLPDLGSAPQPQTGTEYAPPAPPENLTAPTPGIEQAAAPNQPQQGGPAHSSLNNNGLNDIDALLEQELNGNGGN